MSRKEHSKLVLWPCGPTAGPQGPIYRYKVVGMIATDQPLDGIEGCNEIVVTGATHFASLLEMAPKRKAEGCYENGTRMDANGVLLELERI